MSTCGAHRSRQNIHPNIIKDTHLLKSGWSCSTFTMCFTIIKSWQKLNHHNDDLKSNTVSSERTNFCHCSCVTERRWCSPSWTLLTKATLSVLKAGLLLAFTPKECANDFFPRARSRQQGFSVKDLNSFLLVQLSKLLSSAHPLSLVCFTGKRPPPKKSGIKYWA